MGGDDHLPLVARMIVCLSIKALNINESCIFNEQCSETTLKTECRHGRCACIYELVPVKSAEGYSCVGETYVEEPIRTIDPAMIGVLVGMALMFVIICVVLRLFSKARWSENRTIFNTPNPRLMNVSLLRESKLLHSQERRGSRISMRPPSRQTSQQDLRSHSPARHHQSHQLHRKTSGYKKRELACFRFLHFQLTPAKLKFFYLDDSQEVSQQPLRVDRFLIRTALYLLLICKSPSKYNSRLDCIDEL
ncbi:hypothetical protein EVAR_96780_1 [Eumeta japonica]|uniref:EB domain-containing protein n=1 Tax=Eumeta variegata TaxID=151549 RepID=A0A4C1WSC2_EUMVA|nr:hypothetical protein EVAR_96780_1 [Eumeta japonica]